MECIRLTLSGEFKGDSLVLLLSTFSSGILMLADRSYARQQQPTQYTNAKGNRHTDLRVDRSLGTFRRPKSDPDRVPLESAIDQSGRHTVDVVGSFGICECLIGRGLLETRRVGDGPCTLSGGAVSEETKDAVFDQLGNFRMSLRYRASWSRERLTDRGCQLGC